MRINVYSQELTDEVIEVSKVSNTGIVYTAAQLVLHSSPMLHHPPEDDDRSAVTFWLPKSTHRRLQLAVAFERIAEIFRNAPAETGSTEMPSALFYLAMTTPIENYPQPETPIRERALTAEQAIAMLLDRALDAAGFLSGIGRNDRAQPLRDAVHAVWPDSAKSMDADAIKDAIAILESDGDEHGVAAKLRAAITQQAPPKPKPWPAPFEVVQKWALENGYSGASDDVACEAYEKAHPVQEAVGLIIGQTRCYGDDEWYREITAGGIQFLAPLDQQDAAQHYLAARHAERARVPELCGWTLKLMPDRDDVMAIWACDPDGTYIYLAAAPSQPVERARVPDGWALVPIEINGAMISAIHQAYGEREYVTTQAIREGYEAMLAAAQAQPEDAPHA